MKKKPATKKSQSKKQILDELEDVIDQGTRGFLSIGGALKKIRDEKLYKQTEWKTFTEYCRKRWDYDRSYFNRCIQAWEIFDALKDALSDVTVLESHIRELRPLFDHFPHDEAMVKSGEVFRQVLGETKGKLTADRIRQAVTETIPATDQPPEETAVQPAVRDAKHAASLQSDAVKQLDKLWTGLEAAASASMKDEVRSAFTSARTKLSLVLDFLEANTNPTGSAAAASNVKEAA